MNRKTNENPKVSIIIPVFNGGNYLREAIESALRQSYHNIEVIVVNDGSDDGLETQKIAASYKNEIRYFEKENGGVASALNLGIREMQGEYFSWLSHDDTYLPNKVYDQIEYLRGLDWPSAVIYSDFETMDEEGNTIERITLPTIEDSEFPKWLTMNNSIHGCTLLIPKICFNAEGVFSESLLTTQDYEMWFRLLKRYRFVHLDKVLVKSRQHSNQTGRKMNYLAVKECDSLMKNAYLTFFYDNDLEQSRLSPNDQIAIADSFYRRGYFNAANKAYKDLNSKSGVAFNARLKSFVLASTASLKERLRKRKNAKFDRYFGDVRKRFTNFYNLNTFGSDESRSGEGSTLQQTKVIREQIPLLTSKYQLKTFIDAPCGDLNWMRFVELPDVEKYYGIDIVEHIIRKNEIDFNDGKKSFYCKNLIEDQLPGGDVVLCRDCLVHLTFDDALKVIQNFKRANIKYLLVTTFTDRTSNKDLVGEDIWRPLNMNLPPFNFPQHLELINEGCTEADNQFSDKSLALYQLSSITFE